MSNFHHPQPLTDEQIKVLEDVKPRILEEAQTFDMEYFSMCGSPSCIAGHIVAMVEPRLVKKDDFLAIESTAKVLLGGESIFFKVPLFFGLEWDTDLFSRYFHALQVERAQIAIEAIDRYIANTKAHFAEAQT